MLRTVASIVILLTGGLASGILFPEDASEETGTCLRSGSPLVPCVVSGAVSWTEAVRSKELQLGDGLVLLPEVEDQEPVSGDPREAGTLLEAVDRALSSRRLSWDLTWLYPGLSMIVSRAPDPRLYFAVDRRAAVHDQRETTGRLIMKRTLLPVLLGVKLKLASLVPLLVAGLVILAKKALLLSKLSLLVTGLTFFRGNTASNSGGTGPLYSSSGSTVFGGHPVRHPIDEEAWLNRGDALRDSNSSFQWQ